MSTQNLIGVDLGGTNLRVGRVSGEHLEELSEVAISKTSDPDDLIQQIIIEIRNAFDDSVEAIGVGVPSVVDVEKGIVYDVQNIPSWKKVPLKDILEKEFSKPVFINNDANCFALGEKYYGAAKGKDNVAGLILGTGFGSGLILNGKLYSGKNCGAGEVGMLPYQDSIFEHYCSGQFFELHKDTTGKEAYLKAIKGDKTACEMFQELGMHVGNAMKAVLYAYDPEVIILGGSVSGALDLFSDDMWNSMKDFAYPKSLENLKITNSKLEQVAVLGAAALALDKQATTGR